MNYEPLVRSRLSNCSPEQLEWYTKTLPRRKLVSGLLTLICSLLSYTELGVYAGLTAVLMFLIWLYHSMLVSYPGEY